MSLPAELIQTVLAHVDSLRPGDRMESLRCLSLLSPAWMPLCQQRLFHTLTLDDERHALAVPRLYFLSTRPHLAMIVEQVVLGQLDILAADLARWLPAVLPNVRQLHIDDSELLERDAPAVSLLIPSLRSLRHLAVFGGAFPYHDEAVPEDVDLDLETGIQLESLDLFASGPLAAIVLRSLARADCVRTLRTASIVCTDWDALVAIVYRLQFFSELSELEITLPSWSHLERSIPGGPPIVSALALRGESNLRKLVVTIQATEGTTLSVLRALFHSLELPKLLSLTLTLFNDVPPPYRTFVPFSRVAGHEFDPEARILDEATTARLHDLTVDMSLLDRVIELDSFLAMFGDLGRRGVLSVREPADD